MSNSDLFNRVKGLNLPTGKYALFGSAPLGIRELKVCHDIDIIVTEDLWNEFKNQGWELKMVPNGSEYLVDNYIELWKNWLPGQWNIESLINDAEIIDGLPFVKLENVIEWKKQNGREKDIKDIETIEKFLGMK